MYDWCSFIRYMLESGSVHRPHSDSLIVSSSSDQHTSRPRTRRKIHREGGFRIKNKSRTAGAASAAAASEHKHGEHLHAHVKPRKDSPMPTRSERLQILRSLSLSALSFKETEQQQQHQQHHHHSSGSDMSELSSGEVPVVIPWLTDAHDLRLSRPGSGRTTDSGSTLVDKNQGSPATHKTDSAPIEEPVFQRTQRSVLHQDSSRGGGAVGGVGPSGDIVLRDRRQRRHTESSSGQSGGMHHLFHTDSDSINSGTWCYMCLVFCMEYCGHLIGQSLLLVWFCSHLFLKLFYLFCSVLFCSSLV